MNKEFILKDVSGQGCIAVVDGNYIRGLFEGREIWDDAYHEYTTAWEKIDALDLGDEWYDSLDNIKIIRAK